MKKTLTLLAVLAVLLILPGVIWAQTPEPTAPAGKMIEFQMAILKRGPKWTGSRGADDLTIQQSVDYFQSLLKSGKAVIAGAIKRDESDLVGVCIFRAKSADEASAWVMADPAVAAGYIVPELHPWWSEDVMKKTETPQKFMTVYLAFLVRGEKWTPEKTPQTEEIQKGHMANINRLADMKKLVVAGPFGDDGTLRGIFVFRVATLEEARALTLTDPAVQSGRLALELHPWSVPEGILP
jgi:uncharacterized protein YciI